MGPGSARETHLPSSSTLLLVEDNPAYIRLVRELLAEAGLEDYEVLWTDTLEEGLQRLEDTPVDVVLLDLLLPDNLGTDTLELTLEKAEGTPVVVLTGIEDDQLAEEALNLGAADYLCKGRLDPEHLTQAIAKAFETADDPQPATNGSRGEMDDLLPVLADRISEAASALERAEEHIDPLAPEAALEAIRDERERCRSAAESLLEIESVTQAEVTQQPISLHDVIDDALVRLSTRGDVGGRVTLDWENPPTVHGDPVALTRLFELVIANLLDDASEAGHLRVAADREGSTWEISMSEPNIAPEGPNPLDAVFDRVPEAEGVPGEVARALCKAIADRHGTRLRAGEDEGLALRLSLPATAPQGSDGDGRPDEHRKTL